ncbi:MAG TPA: GldG family protein [Candidatus Dormibacteraeota bacterium]
MAPVTRWDRSLALACAVVGVLLLLTTLSFVIVDRGLSQRTAFLLFAGLALAIIYMLLDPGAVIALARDRRSRAGSWAVLASAVVAGLLIGINVVASRSTQATDLTRAGLYTLSSRSVTVVDRLDTDLVVTGFYRSDEQATKRDVQTLLNLYQQRSPHIKVRFLDPNQAGGLALSLGVKTSGSIVLQYRNKAPVVLNLAEQNESSLTGAILRLESTRSPTVCWATGDGERSLEDTNEVSGYSAVADLLRGSDYRVQNLLLVQQGVPASCDVLVVLQLSRPISDASVTAIRDHLARGGKLLLAIDPWLDARIVTSANAVLSQYGAGFDGGLVMEPDTAHAAAGDSTVPVVYSWGSSPITKDLDRRYVFFPLTTAITGGGAAGVRAVNLASTSERSYVIPQERTVLDRRATDRPGPFVLMRSLEEHRPAGTTRIVIAGTSALAENRTLPPSASSSNQDLLRASLDWLTQQDSLIAIGPKPPAAQPLSLSGTDQRLNAVFTVGVLPLLVLIAGSLVRARRRAI